MRRKSLVSGLLYLLILMVVGYMAYYIYVAISTPFETTEAVLYTAEEIVSIKGTSFAMRSLFRRGGPVQQILLSDGEKVHKGQVLSVSYDSEEDMRIHQQLAWYRELLSLLNEAISDENIVDIERVDRNISLHLESLVYGVENPKSVDLKQEIINLKTQVLKRGLAFSNTGRKGFSRDKSSYFRVRRLSVAAESGVASVISLFRVTSRGLSTVLRGYSPLKRATLLLLPSLMSWSC